MSQEQYRLQFLVLVIVGLWIMAWAAGVTTRFTSESIRGLLAGKGLWEVVVFTALFSAGQLLRVPGPVFVASAVAVCGGKFGMLIALLGALVSVNVSFAVVRTFAGGALTDVQRPLVRRLLGQNRQSAGDDCRAAAANLPNGTTNQLCVTDDHSSLERSSGGVRVGPSGARAVMALIFEGSCTGQCDNWPRA